MFSLYINLAWRMSVILMKNAFVKAALSQDIYIMTSVGLVKKQYEDYVYRLNNRHYGQLQASKGWNVHFNKFLIDIGCKRSILIKTCTFRRTEIFSYFLVVCPDDTFLISNTEFTLAEVNEGFSKRIAIRTWKEQLPFNRDQGKLRRSRYSHQANGEVHIDSLQYEDMQICCNTFASWFRLVHPYCWGTEW